MANSTTEALLTIKLCPNEDLICAGRFIEAANIGVNVISVVVNIFHMMVLSRLRWLQRQTYFFILVHISIADIASAFAMMVRSSCVINHLALSFSPLAGAAVSACVDTAGIMKWYVLSVACVERYLAVCHALRYNSFFLVNHIQKVLAFLWIPACIMMMGRDLMFRDSICINSIIGINNFTSAWPGIISAVNLLVPSIVSIVTLTKTWQELRKMKLGIDTIDQRTKRSAIYLMIISAVFYICLLPASVYILMMSFGFTKVKVLLVPFCILYSLYGVLNTLIYGWNIKSYRKAVSNLFLGKSATTSSPVSDSRGHAVAPTNFKPSESP